MQHAQHIRERALGNEHPLTLQVRAGVNKCGQYGQVWVSVDHCVSKVHIVSGCPPCLPSPLYLSLTSKPDQADRCSLHNQLTPPLPILLFPETAGQGQQGEANVQGAVGAR